MSARIAFLESEIRAIQAEIARKGVLLRQAEDALRVIEEEIQRIPAENTRERGEATRRARQADRDREYALGREFESKQHLLVMQDMMRRARLRESEEQGGGR